MAVTVSKKPKQRDLGAEIENLRADLLAFFEQKVAEMKASRDGASLPINVLRQELGRNDTCLCRIVERLLGESQ
jgi:hypothetical protein